MRYNSKKILCILLVFIILTSALAGCKKTNIVWSSFARVLAANPDIIMFDEATSSIDNITQSIIIKALEQMCITRIVIAHRLSTIRNCSKIICIDRGQIVEVGTYAELIEKDGFFAGFTKRQFI